MAESSREQPDITFSDPKVQGCPFAAYSRLREENKPVYKDPKTGFYHLTREADIRAAFADPVRFSSATGIRGVQQGSEESQRLFNEAGGQPTEVLLGTDPPAHKSHRSLVDKVFSVNRIQALEGFITETTDRLISAFEAQPQIDFVSAFAIPLPMTVIADQLGISADRMDDFKRWSDAGLDSADANLTPERHLETTHTRVEARRFFTAEIENQRRQPRDCIIGDLVNTSVDGKQLPMADLLSLIELLFVAGNETTTNALGSVMSHMIRGGYEAQLRADPALIPVFVEEVLRLESPLQRMPRRTTEDVTIADTVIPKGSIVFLELPAANRDDQCYPDADKIRLDRKAPGRHMTFGFGIHYCIGNQLARAELRIAFNRLLTRLRNFRLADGPSSDERVPHWLGWGPKKLLIEFDRA